MTSGLLQTQGERIRRVLRRRIQSGEYAPGTRLTLRGLAREMGASVIPVRDALARLWQEGLVETVPGRGWRVSDYGPERLSDLAVLRGALECEVARLCALRAKEQEREELAFLGRQVDRAKTQETSNELEERFHLRLAEVAGSPALLEAINRANVLELTFGPLSPHVGKRHLHETLARAISSGDPDAAERAMRKHFTRDTSFDGSARRRAGQEGAARSRKVK